MSMTNTNIHCHGCDFKSVMQRRSITLEYMLPNNVVVHGYRVFAWCSTCNNITEAEQPFYMESIQAEIDSLKPRQAGFIRRIFGGGKEIDDEIQHLYHKLQLVQDRQSPPRCLRCGETTVIPLDFDENGTSNVIHICGHHLYMVPDDPDAPRFMYRPEVIRLDPEGYRI